MRLHSIFSEYSQKKSFQATWYAIKEMKTIILSHYSCLKMEWLKILGTLLQACKVGFYFLKWQAKNLKH